MFEDSAVFPLAFSSLSILSFEILPPEAEFSPSSCGLIDALIGIALFFDKIYCILMATVILEIYGEKTHFNYFFLHFSIRKFLKLTFSSESIFCSPQLD